MKKYYRVLKELIRLRFQNLMLFRIGVIGPFFVDGSLFAIQLAAFSAVYSNVDRIGSWGKGEMILYIGSFSLLNAVSMLICFFGLITIPDKIMRGEMDLYLTKPISPLFRLSFEKINPGSVLLVVMSLFIIGHGVRLLETPPAAANIAAWLFWLLLMQILHYETEVVVRSITFFALSNNRVDQLEGAALEMCMQLPGNTFYGVYKIIFCVILPYGILATLPVQSMIGQLTLPMAAQGLAVTAGYTFLTIFIWKKGIRHYNSASS